jgi:GMP synthase PP-ATPase subunit
VCPVRRSRFVSSRHNALQSHRQKTRLRLCRPRFAETRETERVKKVFGPKFGKNLIIVDAKKIFLNKLKGVTDPELKRKIIGHTFIEVFDREAKNSKE